MSLSTFLRRAGLWIEVVMLEDPFNVNTGVSVCTDILCKGRKDVKDRGASFLGDSPPNIRAMWDTSSQAAFLGAQS